MLIAAPRLRALRSRVALALLLGFGGLRTAHPQTSATIKMDHGEITAGDKLSMELTFDQAATCSQQVVVGMRGTANSNQFYLAFQGALDPGKDIATLAVTVPRDYEGEFHTEAQQSYLNPCVGFSVTKYFSVTPVTFNVRGLPDPNKYPTKAGVVLSLTQKQFLDTKVTELKDLSGQIDTRVEGDGRDSAELRTFLSRIVEKAETDLQVTERQYRTELLKPTDPLPAFFADFRRQYEDLHVELRAPIPGMRASVGRPAHLLFVQQPLNRRPSTTAPARSGNLSGTAPAIARATKATVNDNASAYSIVNSTGRAVFHAQFMSFPPGATLNYRQAILPDFKTWSSKTNISGADFELATFVFKFQKDECEDEPVQTIDPYTDTNPIVSVEFKRCGKK
jgi:hypothetical protein